MKEKKSFGDRLEAFFAGKGFYAVLVLCVAVIGVSAWSMLSGGSGEDSNSTTLEEDVLFDDSINTSLTEYPVVTETINLKPEESDKPDEPESDATAEDAATVQTNASSYFVWPVVGEILSEYSMEALVYNATMADWRTHDGIDIAAEIGASVSAVSDGTVEAVYADDLFGTTIVIAHANSVKSIYSNLAAEPAVAVGGNVAVGQTIGSIGNTAIGEANEEAHLHFAMRSDDESVNPLNYLP